MAFLELLPTELLYLIATRLDTRSVSQLILTSQHFNVLLIPHLHRNVTPLQLVADLNRVNLLSLFLASKSPAYVKGATKSVHCALQVGVRSGHVEVVKLLLDKGADIGCRNGGWTLACFAVVSNQPEMLKLLIERGVPLDRRGEMGYAAFEYAALTGKLEIVEILLAAGEGKE